VNLCENSPDKFCQYRCQSIGDLLNWKDYQTKNLGTEKQIPTLYIVVADLKTLYPDECRDTVTKSPQCTLKTHSITTVSTFSYILVKNETSQLKPNLTFANLRFVFCGINSMLGRQLTNVPRY